MTDTYRPLNDTLTPEETKLFAHFDGYLEAKNTVISIIERVKQALNECNWTKIDVGGDKRECIKFLLLRAYCNRKPEKMRLYGEVMQEKSKPHPNMTKELKTADDTFRRTGNDMFQRLFFSLYVEKWTAKKGKEYRAKSIPIQAAIVFPEAVLSDDSGETAVESDAEEEDLVVSDEEDAPVVETKVSEPKKVHFPDNLGPDKDTRQTIVKLKKKRDLPVDVAPPPAKMMRMGLKIKCWVNDVEDSDYCIPEQVLMFEMPVGRVISAMNMQFVSYNEKGEEKDYAVASCNEIVMLG